MIKKEYPILEFDQDKTAFIEPRAKTDVVVPNRLVICFFKEIITSLLENNEIIPIASLPSEMMDIILYKFIDADCCIVQGTLGAPACAGYLEDFIALGINKVMFCGGAGVLRSDITVGKFVVVDSAIRDEGFSYHYIKPAREIKTKENVVNLITKYLDNNKIQYVKGKSWTTDAFYRETKAKIALRVDEGCIIVEMEQSAMLAVSEFRKIDYGAIIYGGDDLTKEVWDSRNWRKRVDVRSSLTNICKDIVLSM